MFQPMNLDISDLLSGWDFKPGQVIARRFEGRDGKEKIQLRVDLGILQMNAEGRPDGRRPMAHDSWYDLQVKRLQRHVESTGSEEGFSLNSDICSKLQQECIQYHHRYICFFQLEDFAAVERDCERNLQVFEFVAEHAETDELAWSLLQFVPQLLMMRTRARGSVQMKKQNFTKATAAIEEGIEELETFYRENGREDLMANSGELASLRVWMDEVRDRRPLTEIEKLQRALEEAIRAEDYERAAEVRDQMRKLQASDS